jgi:hypothetical protein
MNGKSNWHESACNGIMKANRMVQGKALDSYSGGARFDSRPGHWLSWLTDWLDVFHSGKFQDSTSGHSNILPVLPTLSFIYHPINQHCIVVMQKRMNFEPIWQSSSQWNLQIEFYKHCSAVWKLWMSRNTPRDVWIFIGLWTLSVC